MSIRSSHISNLLPTSVPHVLSALSRRRRSRMPARAFILMATTAIGLVLAVSLYLSFALPGSFDLTTMHTAAGRLAVRWVAPNGPANGLGVVAGALLVRGTAHHALTLSLVGAVQRRLVLSPSLLVPTLWDLLDAILGFVTLILGLVVRLRSTRAAARAFWRLSLLASLALALNPATTHGILWAIVLQGLALRLFGPALLALVRAFTRHPSSTPHPWRWLLPWLPALLLVVLYPLYWVFPAPFSRVVPEANGLTLVGYIVAAAIAVAYALSRPRSARQRARLHWLATGLLGGLLPFELLTLLPLTLVGRVILAPRRASWLWRCCPAASR